ncbi:MarR family transcriptional regulator [Paenibacillus sp. N1-5-1-14]|uniref:MarR family winged helix-turn-helix transcriptional regulator n=1 Tax=Paenibacillus radicibacter TaxID=2972488 RepID=UPI002159291F|nr:MarR family transcriptional regulator [Paenibacillus radicibacter]MCR8643485.1 MarR family transcriptional regulator [Paenibacillus radicibacter]
MNHPIDRSIGPYIHRTDLRLSAFLQKRIQPYELTTEQWRVLSHLSEQEAGITQKELAHKLYKDQTSVARILDKMLKKELIERHCHPEDGRACLLFISEKGRLLREGLIPVVVEVLDQSLKGITDEEVHELKRILDKIYQNLE